MKVMFTRMFVFIQIAEFVTEVTVLAIDWHMVVFEELLDTNNASEVKNHDSLAAEQARAMVRSSQA
jgi:hypothetical protein